ncbi:MAG: hypothetical protein QM784_28000 [Polyangiaceae bacterium]
MTLDVFHPVPCPKCGGGGKFREKPCATCGGSGQLYRKLGSQLVAGVNAAGCGEAAGTHIHVPPFPAGEPGEVPQVQVDIRRSYEVK